MRTFLTALAGIVACGALSLPGLGDEPAPQATAQPSRIERPKPVPVGTTYSFAASTGDFTRTIVAYSDKTFEGFGGADCPLAPCSEAKDVYSDHTEYVFRDADYNIYRTVDPQAETSTLYVRRLQFPLRVGEAYENQFTGKSGVIWNETDTVVGWERIGVGGQEYDAIHLHTDDRTEATALRSPNKTSWQQDFYFAPSLGAYVKYDSITLSSHTAHFELKRVTFPAAKP